MSNILLMGTYNDTQFAVEQKDTRDATCDPIQSCDLTMVVCAEDDVENGTKRLMEKAREHAKKQLEYFSRGYNYWQARLDSIR